MPNRAVIIAIENYPGVKGAISASLPGVHHAAEDFLAWLTEQKLVQPEDVFVCSDGMTLPPAGGRPKLYGATHDAIVDCLANLLQIGTDTTENLFVYCGGHGFAYTSDSTRPGLSFLLTSEFSTPARSGGACIDLDRLQRQLVRSLSGTRHFHFVDCCRNLIPADAIEPVSALGIPFPASSNGEASCFALYSARLGSTAAANASFSEALMRGLHGFGYGKQLSGDSFWVTFDGVHKELKRVFGKPFDRMVTGVATGEILNLGDVTLPCTVTIADTTAADQYDLLIRNAAGWNQTLKLPADGETVNLTPSDRPYTFELRRNGVALVRTAPPPGLPIDMYLAADIVFAPAPPVANLAFNVGREIGRPTLTSFSYTQFTDDLDETAMADDTAYAPRSESDESNSSGFAVPHPAPPRPDPLKLLDRALFHGATPSEQRKTGLLDDAGPATRLACAGLALAQSPTAGWAAALRRALPLTSADPADERPALIVLAFAPEAAPRFSPSRVGSEELAPMIAAGDLPGLYFASLTNEPGSLHVTLQLPGRPPTTFVTRTLPGSVTVLTAHVADVLGVRQLQVQQFFWSCSAARHEQCLLPAAEPRQSAQVRTLITARLLSLAQERFLQRKPIWKTSFAPPQVWSALEGRRWHNGDLLVLAVFDAFRRGSQGDLTLLLDLVGDAAPFQPDLAWLKGEGGSSLQGSPLLLDALLIEQSHNEGSSTAQPLFGIPENRVDYRGMWISWLATG